MIWLIGAGGMSIDYAKVLHAQKKEIIVIGRGEASARLFEEKTKHAVLVGGLGKFLSTSPDVPEAAIVSVGVEQLYSMSMQLLKYGVKHLLVEKPAGMDAEQIRAVADEAKAQQASVYVAYNRRFFSSVLAAKAIVEQDGGVDSFNFELTEWGHVIGTLTKGEGVLENWFLANTSHVTDLAFYLGGKPEQLSCFTNGSTDWHQRSANFAGAGQTASGALFNYHGNWNAPGRWSVEVLTKKHRLILRPMERLQIQNIGSVAMEFVDIDDALDKTYKPGLFSQVKGFIAGDHEGLCSLAEQLEMVGYYQQMAGYK